MSYAIISVGGKQYRVQEGQRLLVDRLPQDEGKTFTLDILLLGGDGNFDLAPQGATVTARVVQHVLGEKVVIGKMKPKSGYRRRNGYRSRLSQIEIEAIGKTAARKTEAPAAAKPASAKAPAAERAAPAAPEKPRQAHPPANYDELTVAEIGDAAAGWRLPNLEAALEHERANANRKGAIAALESAIAAKKEKS